MASKPFIDARRGVWYCKVRLGGEWRKIKLGDHGAPFPANRPPKRAPADILARRDELAEKERQERLGQPSGIAGRTRLKKFAEAYLGGFKTTKQPESYRIAERNIHLFVAFAAKQGVFTLEDVGRPLCREFLEERAKKLSPASLRMAKGYVAAMFNRAWDDEILAANPWARVKVPGRAAISVPTVWTSEEIQKIAAACPKKVYGDLFLVMANTGIRASAALAMRWGWVDRKRRLVHVPSEHDKTGKGYSAPMGSEAFLILWCDTDLTTPKEYVFLNERGLPIRYKAALNHLQRATKKAGVPYGTLHDLRHTFARHYALVAPVNAVQAALGHSSLAMTDRYLKHLEGTTLHSEGFGIGRPEPGPTGPSASDQS